MKAKNKEMVLELNWERISYSILAENNWVFRGRKAIVGRSVLLGNVLEKIKPPRAKIEPNQKYYELTVRTNGRGVERRIKNKQDYVLGSEIGSSRYIAPSDCLILSKIDARNGSIGAIPKNLGGSLVTGTFVLFGLKKEYDWVSLSYLVILLTSTDYQSYFESLSCGTTNRRNLSIDDFLNTKIEIGEKHDKFLIKQKRKEELEEELKSINNELSGWFN